MGNPSLRRFGVACRAAGAIESLRPGEEVSRDLCRTLANNLLCYASPSRLLQLAAQGDFSILHATDSAVAETEDRELSGVRIAIAYDDVFHCYFPDALDALESRGEIVQDFSPLRDEALPLDTDLVVIGCGHPERFAHELGQNHCLVSACGSMFAQEGGFTPKAAGWRTCVSRWYCPAAKWREWWAFFRQSRGRIQTRARPPLEVPLACDSWLGPAGSVVRGYLNEAWELEHVGRIRPLGASTGQPSPLILRHQAVGSRLHLNIIAQPQLLGGFLRPCPAALAWAAT